MSTAWRAAAGLAVLVALVHSYLGERYILIRLFKRDLPKTFGGTEFTKNTLRFAWHITSIAWLGFAALLVTMAGAEPRPARAFANVVAATFLATGLVALAGSRGRHPAWVVFFAIAALVYFG